MAIHSYSAIKTYKTCPRQYEALYVKRNVKRTSSPALEKGIAVHEAFENALGGQALPAAWSKWSPLVQTLRQAQAEPEVKLAVNHAGEPCDFWDKQAKLRGAIDVRLQGDNRVVMLDWKTGKVYPDRLQADFYAVMQWAETPKVKIQFTFVYLEHNKTVPVDVDPGAVTRVNSLLEHVDSVTNYPPKPCFACRFCPVTSCEYHD